MQPNKDILNIFNQTDFIAYIQSNNISSNTIVETL